jgi:hypothetical protein
VARGPAISVSPSTPPPTTNPPQVWLHTICPIPPPTPAGFHDALQPHDDVEVFACDGWWDATVVSIGGASVGAASSRRGAMGGAGGAQRAHTIVVSIDALPAAEAIDSFAPRDVRPRWYHHESRAGYVGFWELRGLRAAAHKPPPKKHQPADALYWNSIAGEWAYCGGVTSARGLPNAPAAPSAGAAPASPAPASRVKKAAPDASTQPASGAQPAASGALLPPPVETIKSSQVKIKSSQVEPPVETMLHGVPLELSSRASSGYKGVYKSSKLYQAFSHNGVSLGSFPTAVEAAYERARGQRPSGRAGAAAYSPAHATSAISAAVDAADVVLGAAGGAAGGVAGGAVRDSGLPHAAVPLVAPTDSPVKALEPLVAAPSPPQHVSAQKPKSRLANVLREAEVSEERVRHLLTLSLGEMMKAAFTEVRAGQHTLESRIRRRAIRRPQPPPHTTSSVAAVLRTVSCPQIDCNGGEPPTGSTVPARLQMLEAHVGLRNDAAGPGW